MNSAHLEFLCFIVSANNLPALSKDSYGSKHNHAMNWLRNAAVAASNGGGSTTTGITQFVRYFSRKCAPNLRKINPKVPPQEASAIAQNLYDVIKQHGPVTISNTWIHVQDASISGLNSKTHLKLMLKWMQGRKLLKQSCNHVGPTKRFVLSVLPGDPNALQQPIAPDMRPRTGKLSFRTRARLRKV